MMAKFVLILYVPGIPALSMSDIDFDFGGVWPKEIIKSNRDCLSNQQFLQIWNSGADFFRGWNIQYFSIGVKNHYISAEHVVLTW